MPTTGMRAILRQLSPAASRSAARFRGERGAFASWFPPLPLDVSIVAFISPASSHTASHGEANPDANGGGAGAHMSHRIPSRSPRKTGLIQSLFIIATPRDTWCGATWRGGRSA
ncbi:hypothetical protein DQ04_10981000 [Trypanosoma grayi]|uniref:hypothetical protein n=1 Tax=Trypanosoma grayi TaxID=71804 RepID=UPI0004F41994|nr:hypothetical protein DQ04_10981000 [Trypanosoma grayi]KEG07082.1 hypothetical protein DQ04_10981000 [Trypanosoma grayi]